MVRRKGIKGYVGLSFLLALCLVGCVEEKEVVVKPIEHSQEVVTNIENTKVEEENTGDVLIMYPVVDFETDVLEDIKVELQTRFEGFQILELTMSEDKTTVNLSMRAKDYERIQKVIKTNLDEAVSLKVKDGLFKTFDPSKYLTNYLIVVDDVTQLTDDYIEANYEELVQLGWDYQQVLSIVPADIKVYLTFKDNDGNEKEYTMAKYPLLEQANW